MEMTNEEKIFEVWLFVDDQFRALFRDVYNVIEISYDHNKEIMGKIKELVGKRIAIANEESIKAIDSLCPEGFSQSLPPISSRYSSSQE